VRDCIMLVVLVITAPLWFPIAVVVVVAWLVVTLAIYLAVWVSWLPRSKSILFVYSDSPSWYDYVETNILPAIKDRAVILNWSQRSQWPRFGSLAVLAFKHFGGYREFNPMGIVFHPFRRAKVFRFWQPFKDYKHGNNAPLELMQKDFLTAAADQSS
jgi:hypothetical protein